jgi:acetylglutamate kinase
VSQQVNIVIKLGGSLLDAPESRSRLAAEIAAVRRAGVHAVVVHGGGKQMTRFLAEGGIESEFVDGLRVTTPEVLDAMLKVFAGSVNHQLVAALVAAGVPAVGLSGMDASLVEAEQLSRQLGAVGRPVGCNPALLRLLMENAYLPVVACVAGDRCGNFYNVNADQMAVVCASALSAAKLLFLTDVDGVKDGQGRVVSRLTRAAAQGLIESGVASGGMRAKLDAASAALAQGVAEVVIAPGVEPGILGRLLSDARHGEMSGTRLVPDSLEVPIHG